MVVLLVILNTVRIFCKNHVVISSTLVGPYLKPYYMLFSYFANFCSHIMDKFLFLLFSRKTLEILIILNYPDENVQNRGASIALRIEAYYNRF